MWDTSWPIQTTTKTKKELESRLQEVRFRFWEAIEKKNLNEALTLQKVWRDLIEIW